MSVAVAECWSEAELGLLRDVSLSLSEVAARTGRNIKGCYNQASRLGIRRNSVTGIDWDDQEQVRDLHRRYDPRVTDRRAWSAQELALVDDVALSYPEVARITGRSYWSVKTIAGRRGVRRGPYWTDPDYIPGSIGWRGPDWPKVREVVLVRDGFTCQDGGEFIPSGDGLVVHHMIPWRLRPVNDFDWLVTLCRSHHMQRPEHNWAEIPDEVLDLLTRERR